MSHDLTADEKQALVAVTSHLWEQAQKLPATSRVRAGLLRIHDPLTRSVGDRPLTLVDDNLEAR